MLSDTWNYEIPQFTPSPAKEHYFEALEVGAVAVSHIEINLKNLSLFLVLTVSKLKEVWKHTISLLSEQTPD